MYDIISLVLYMEITKISKVIKDIRNKNNLTQNDLANELGVTFQAVSKWERGLNIPDISILTLICEKYHYDINDLLNTNHVKKNKKIYVVLFIIIVFLLLSCIVLLLKKDDFKLSSISSVCKSYIVSGSIAYNKDKTMIIIQDINYCDDDNKEYKSIECLLSKVEDNKTIVIDSFEKKENMTIKDYMKLVKFNVDSKKDDCNYLKNTTFKLTVNVTLDDDLEYSHDVPLTFGSTCSK